jgi:hypothetical protein
MKWKIVEPSDLRVNLDVPSGMRPLPCMPRIFGQRFVLGDWQKMHVASLPAQRAVGGDSGDDVNADDVLVVTRATPIVEVVGGWVGG